MTIRCLLLSYICIVLYTKFSTAVQYGRRTTSTAARTYGRIIFKKNSTTTGNMDPYGRTYIYFGVGH